jgi:hypothetical protein
VTTVSGSAAMLFHLRLESTLVDTQDEAVDGWKRVGDLCRSADFRELAVRRNTQDVIAPGFPPEETHWFCVFLDWVKKNSCHYKYLMFLTTDSEISASCRAMLLNLPA